MKITGVLSWYDESPGWLAAAVTGFARVCDEIVAVDGAYALLPGARPCSHPEQAEAVISAAEAAGVAATVHRPSGLFYGNEVEKRNVALRIAGATLQPGVDWLVVFDADCHVFKCDPGVVRWELESTDCLLASYVALDGADYLSDPEMHDLAKRDEYPTEWTARTKDIYRWDPSLLYGPQHWTVSRIIHGERVWLRSSNSDEPVCDLDAALVVYHRTKDRTHMRKLAQDGYYRARELHQVERWVNGDPADNGVSPETISAKG